MAQTVEQRRQAKAKTLERKRQRRSKALVTGAAEVVETPKRRPR